MYICLQHMALNHVVHNSAFAYLTEYSSSAQPLSSYVSEPPRVRHAAAMRVGVAYCASEAQPGKGNLERRLMPIRP